MRVLFILKNNNGYSGAYSYGSSGLLNSARFVVDMLNHNGVEAWLVTVNDNNDIDREVTKFKPDTVIVEALWVVPEKFDVLKTLHPNVKWVIRLHSDFPFLATEGVAMQWLFEYPLHGVSVAFNDELTAEAFSELSYDVIFLPNYYPVGQCLEKHGNRALLHIGCFGAIRPLKNQLTQAIAAIRYADSVGKTLLFHVNATRCEQGGEAVLKNLRALFAGTRHYLVENSWKDHKEFLRLMSSMDLSLCVSFTETFCIVAADAVNVGTPLLCSQQVPWASSTVSTTDTEEIAKGIGKVLRHKSLYNAWNRHGLKKYSENAKKIWLKTLEKV
jgi:hypothetical protein